MGERTKIAWAHSTFNPWVGCAKVSAACAHCYAETWARRTGHPQLWQGVRRRTADATWRRVRRWDREAEESGQSRRVFPSLCDPFEDEHNIASWRYAFWDLVVDTPHLAWLLCTKRPENVLSMVPPEWLVQWPAHVWLGTTVEDQQRADERIPHMLRCPAPVRFLSVEPMLGPVTLPVEFLALGRSAWVICGGESGPGARPMDPDWVDALAAQCHDVGVPFFFKQLGDVLSRQWKCADRSGRTPSEWSIPWQVQEVPHE